MSQALIDAAVWTLDPYLHADPRIFYNPLTDRHLREGEPHYAELRALHERRLSVGDLGAAAREALAREGWIVADDGDLARRFYLKYVSLEGGTLCNQACYFCPVSLKPRESHWMPMDLYERIAAQLAEFRHTIEGVSMIQYNEPTADPRFLEQIGILNKYGLPPAVLTNATGLTPKRVDAIVEMGGLCFLSVNLSTLDRERYRQDRGKDHVNLVLSHLDYMKHLRVAKQMEIVVLGTGDENHKHDFAEIQARFVGTEFEVKYYEVMDRAGHVPVGLKPLAPHSQLRGCEQTGSRVLQWLHILSHGKCVMCCEDYDEHYVVGDLTKESVREVLTGPALALLRRWVYGVEEAPEDFLCRKCIYARTCPA